MEPNTQEQGDAEEYEIHEESLEETPIITAEECINSFENLSKDPKLGGFGGLFSVLQNMMTDNKGIINNVIHVAQDSAKKFNTSSFTKINFDLIPIKEFLTIVQHINDDDEELTLNLRQSAATLSESLTNENYDEVKDLPETLKLVKDIHRYYLQFMYNKLNKSLIKIKSDIDNIDEKDYTVTDLLKLKDVNL